jgi:hypothetical protein
MEDGGSKICPFCKEKIRQEAVKCRFCGEWLQQQTYPPPAQPQEAKVTEELIHPKNGNLPTHEPQSEQKQTWLKNVALGAAVFRDLQESLNINPSREQWENEFLTRKNPMPPDIMDALWKSARDAGRESKSSTCENADTRIPFWQPSARL